MPPLRVTKKIIEERKENIEPFTSITPAYDNDSEALNVVKESVKVMTNVIYDYFLFLVIMYNIVFFYILNLSGNQHKYDRSTN